MGEIKIPEINYSETPAQRPTYRDELNFAEFPIALLSDSSPQGQKTVTYSDTIYDQGAKAPVTRTLTISASDRYGLPTALDDEVVLGLVQLTHRGGFADRRVHFTRYDLIKTLGWRDESKSYQRINESLMRWLGVTLFYDKAWWSREEQTWVSENFHILDQVTILDRERRKKRLEQGTKDPFAGHSSFTWNEVVFSSLKSGYVKQLNLEFYKELASQIAKRMYRFLDKRFYHRAKLEFDLREFACEHIGLSRNYDNAQIKRKLATAIAELEERKFIKAVPADERFLKVQHGVWRICFIKAQRDSQPGKDNNPLSAELEKRGVSSKTARKLVQDYDAALIRKQIEHHDFLLSSRDAKMSNPAGFLYKAIKDDFALPKALEKAKEPKPVNNECLKPASTRLSSVEVFEKEKADALSRSFDSFFEALSEQEKEEFESYAVSCADSYLKKEYIRGKEAGGLLFRTTRKLILEQAFSGMKKKDNCQSAGSADLVSA